MRRAFTVIELLLVIAIITILAGIIYTAYAGAMATSHASNASSNMMQLGRALLIYSNDHDDRALPSTNYGVPESAPERLWSTLLKPYAKDEGVFVAPGSNGKFAATWAARGDQSIGMNLATALAPNGCQSSADSESPCLAFTEALDWSGVDERAKVGLLAVTANGSADNRYRGYEFSPYTGIPEAGDPKTNPPLVADRDLVAELPALPAELLRPIFARYGADRKGNGRTPVLFADGHADSMSANVIANGRSVVWRVR